MFGLSSRFLLGAALAFPISAFADAVVIYKQGDAQSAIEPATRAPVGNTQRIRNGETVSTGPGGRLTLKFDDGMVVALDESSTLKIADYRYQESMATATADQASFELKQGGIRVVTGDMAERSPNSVAVQGSHAKVNSRGPADFTVVLVNPMYLTVQSGTVVASNASGALALPAGSSVQIAGANAVPLNMTASAMPQAASSSIQSLQVAAGTPGGASIGAAGAAGTAAGAGVAVPAVTFGAAAAAAAIAGDGDDSSSTTHH